MENKMREEFEAWIKQEMDIDCSLMSYGKFDGDDRHRYHCDQDENGAIAVSAMLVAWQASRAELVVELPSMTNNGYEGFYSQTEIRIALDKAGIKRK